MAGNQLLIRVGADVSKAARALNDINGQVQGMATKANKAAKVFNVAMAGVAAGAAVQLARELFELGSAVEETADKFGVVMGPAVEQAAEFVDEFAVRAGFTKRELQDLMSNTVILAKGFGMAAGEAATFSEEIVRTAADMASLNNLPTADVLNRINMALAGETQSLKTLTGFISQADVVARARLETGKETVAAITREERALATLAIIQERAADSMGNLDLTQDSAANTAKRVSAQFRQLRDELGSALLPVFAQLLGALDNSNGLFDIMRTLIDWTAKAAVVFVGVLQSAVVAAQGLGNGLMLVVNVIKALSDDTYSLKDAWDSYKTREGELQAQGEAILDNAKAAWAATSAAKEWASAGDDLAGSLDDATASAEAQAAAAEALAEREAKVAEAIQNRLDIMQQSAAIASRATSDVVREIREIGAAIREEWKAQDMADATAAEFARSLEGLKESQAVVAQMADDDAQRLKDNFVAAASAIGQAFGDVGRAIGDIVGQLASGNVFGAGLAFATMGIGAITRESASERRRREAEEAAAERAQQLADAIADLHNALRDELPIRRMVALGLNDELRTRKLAEQHLEEFTDFINTNLMIPFEDVLVNKVFSGSEASAIFRAFESQDLDFLRGISDSLAGMGGDAGALKALIDQFIDLIEVQGLEADALKATQERAARAKELEGVLRGLSFAERRAIVDGNDRAAVVARLNAAHAEELAALNELLIAGEITRAEFEAWAQLLGDEFAAALADFDEAAREAAEAAEAAAEAERFRAMVDMENLELRYLVLLGMDKEALALRHKIELLEAIEAGRSAEYIALLNTIHAEELRQFELRRAEKAAQDAARAARSQASATREVAKAANEAANGASRIVNAPTGWTFGALRNSVLRGDIGAPGGGGGSSVRIEPGAITVQAAPGQDPVTISEAVLDRIATAIGDRIRSGGYNPFTNVAEGF